MTEIRLKALKLPRYLYKHVPCFVKSPMNFLIWSNYSFSHTGVCLKFDITKDTDLFGNSFPVNYVEKYQPVDFIEDNNSQFFNKVFCTKLSKWEGEKEIRTLKQKFGLYTFDKACLNEIIFGHKSSIEDIKNIKLTRCAIEKTPGFFIF